MIWLHMTGGRSGGRGLPAIEWWHLRQPLSAPAHGGACHMHSDATFKGQMIGGTLLWCHSRWCVPMIEQPPSTHMSFSHGTQCPFIFFSPALGASRPCPCFCRQSLVRVRRALHYHHRLDASVMILEQAQLEQGGDSSAAPAYNNKGRPPVHILLLLCAKNKPLVLLDGLQQTAKPPGALADS